jgi:hypothetical protein
MVLQRSAGDTYQPNLSELSETFTTYFGTQVRTMYNLRLSVVSNITDTSICGTTGQYDDSTTASNDYDQHYEQLQYQANQAQELAMRAQMASSLYSESLTGVILLLTPRDLRKYVRGGSVNRGEKRKLLFFFFTF